LTVSEHRILTSLIHDNQAFAPQHRPYRHLIPSGVEAEDRLGHTSQLFARPYGRLGLVQHICIRRVEDEIIGDRPSGGAVVTFSLDRNSATITAYGTSSAVGAGFGNGAKSASNTAFP
jgi:hypothetical protein